MKNLFIGFLEEKKIPLKAYASTLHGDENGGLATPEDFSDFAQECLELGYKAFKGSRLGAC